MCAKSMDCGRRVLFGVACSSLAECGVCWLRRFTMGLINLDILFYEVLEFLETYGVTTEYLKLAGACGAVALCLYHLWKQMFPTCDYWEKQGMISHNPGMCWNLWDTKKPLHEHEMELYKKYGPVYGRYDNALPVLVVGDPDTCAAIMMTNFTSFSNRRNIKFGHPIIDNILGTLDGADWTRVRKILTHALTINQIRLLTTPIVKCSNRIMEVFHEHQERDVPIDLAKCFGYYIIDIIACCAFGVEINSRNAAENPQPREQDTLQASEFVKNAHMLFQEGNPWSSIFAQYFPQFMRYTRFPLFNRAAVNFFHDFALQVIKERNEDVEKFKNYNDFLQIFLAQNPRGPFIGTSKHKALNAQINENEIIAQCVVFFMAGYETTLSVMQYLFFALAYNQDIQEGLYAEIEEVCENMENDESDIIDCTKTTPYMDAIISESLRLSNPCIRMERTVTSDHYISKYKVQLKKGQLVSLPFYCMHMDPDNFPDPETFDPNRFYDMTPETKKVFNGFGQGSRSCPGNVFALTESKVVLTKLLRAFKIVPSELTKPPLRFRVRQKTTLVPETVWVKVELRDPSKGYQPPPVPSGPSKRSRRQSDRRQSERSDASSGGASSSAAASCPVQTTP